MARAPGALPALPVMNALLAAAVPVEAPVTDVTVYNDQARVTRSTAVTVSGRQELALPPLPAGTDPASIRLEVDGDTGRVHTVDIETTPPRPPAPDGTASASQADALARLDDEIAEAEREREILERLLAATRFSPALGGGDGDGDEPEEAERAARREAPLPRLDPSGWREALRFIAVIGDDLEARLRAAETRRRELDARRAATAAAAAAEAASSRPGTVRVRAAVEGAGATRFRLHYLVTGARWEPVYDVRLDPAREVVTVSLSALVSQSTGEDWDRARLSLSTALPASSTAPPPLAAWRLGARARFVPAPPAARAQAAPAPEPYADETRTAAMGAEAPGRTVAAGPGSLVGYVLDQTGTPIKNVKVKVNRTDAPDGGSRVTYTDEEGRVRFSGLLPGVYDLVVTAPRMRAVVRKGIRVGTKEAAEVDTIMEVESQVEEVKVMERAPVVSTRTATATQAFDEEFFGALSSPAAFRLFDAPTFTPPPPPARRALPGLAPPPGYQPPRLAPETPFERAGGHALVFAALAPESLASGEAARRVPLGSWSWPVTVERTVVPAHGAEAFLTARVESRARHPLPAGPATLYVGDDPAGTARLPLVVPGQPFTLPLGIDRAVTAVRNVALESVETGLIRKDETNTYTVTTELVNPHARAIRVLVQDQIPVTRDDAVTIRLSETTPPAAREAATGLLTWRLVVPPGGTVKLRFVYSIKRPRGRRLQQEGAAP